MFPMFGTQLIDDYARHISDEKQTSVLNGAAAGTAKRYQVLYQDYADPDALRRLAGAIKDHTLQHLGTYLSQAEQALTARGVQVHFAETDEDARQTILAILRQHEVTRLTKSKSMAAEEIHLNAFLIANGVACLESDLGEFIIQLDDDIPSHIVKPIIHKNRREIANTFLREGVAADYNDDPQTITRRARVFLRKKYMDAQACITGANFLCADTGRMVVVTNEGNSRFGLAPVPLHIALVGIEKLIPGERDLAVFLNLLGRSATGQQLTVYTEFINGARGGPSRRPGTNARGVSRQRPQQGAGLQLPGNPPLHPLRRLPEHLPDLSPGVGACLPLAIWRADWRGAHAAVVRRPLPRVCRSAQSLDPVRGLQRSVPGGHPDSRPAAAVARQGQTRVDPLARRHSHGTLRHPRHLARAVAHCHDHVQGHELSAAPDRPHQTAPGLARPTHPAPIQRRRIPQVAQSASEARRQKNASLPDRRQKIRGRYALCCCLLSSVSKSSVFPLPTNNF